MTNGELDLLSERLCQASSDLSAQPFVVGSSCFTEDSQRRPADRFDAQRHETSSRFAERTICTYLDGMSTYQEIEAALQLLQIEDLRRLEQTVRKARQAKENGLRGSALDLPPLNIGRMLRPLSADEDLLGEMLDDTRF